MTNIKKNGATNKNPQRPLSEATPEITFAGFGFLACSGFALFHGERGAFDGPAFTFN